MSRSHTSDLHRNVVADIQMRLASAPGDVRVETELHFSTRDPYAVRATFSRQHHAPIVWVFARDLLVTGSVRHAGGGDVEVFPSGDDVILNLTSPEGSARLAAPDAEIRRFTAQTLAVVAPGDESRYIDIDTELATLDPDQFARDDA